jgi:hypothetical protein
MKDVASFDPSIGVIAKIAHRNVVRAILPRNAPVEVKTLISATNDNQ